MNTYIGRKHLPAIPILVTGIVSLGCTFNPVRVSAAENEQIVGSEITQKTLGAKIKEAGGFAEDKYSIPSWASLRSSIDAARVVADNTTATPSELASAYARVQKTINALEERKVLPDLTPRIGLSASLFATDKQGPADNVSLMWATSQPQESFEIYRASGKSGDFAKIYSGQGASFNDYGLKKGTYSYKLVAYRDGKSLTSNIEQIKTMALPKAVTDYSNQSNQSASLWKPLKIGGLYYRFPSERDGKALKAMWVETSRDNKNWARGAVVMDQSSHPDLADYKLEAVNFFYDQKHNKVVIWAHWERSAGYGSGRALVATATPGERFTVHHIYNPLGIEVRDMSVFRDDNGQGYLVAASNVRGQGANATLYIFKMNEDYTDVTGITNKVMENGYREAPHIIKTGGFYYIFFSQAAGWYPSRAGYATAKSLDGRWSDARPIANSSTFSAQSGGILDFGEGKTYAPIFMPNRWIRGEGTSGNVAIPLHTADGFAFGDYAPTLLVDSKKDLVIPLQEGRLLSQNQPATSSIAGNKGNEVSKAFDGDYNTAFQSDDKKWPFSVTTDLGAISKIRNVQISWHIHKGSEAYYKYTIEGSNDGQQWRVLLDRTDDKNTLVSKTYGFTSDMLSDIPTARYVRVNVQQAVLHNNPNNWYPPTLYEIKVYGNKD